jgi:hypothetical protein
VKLSTVLIALVPAALVTTTSTVAPAVPGGLVAKIAPSPSVAKQGPVLTGRHGVTAADPNATCVAPLKPLPRICTVPAAEPVRGVTPLTTGLVGATYKN